MDAELKAKWIAALRSDKYQQATGCLNNGSGFCCLGVLLDVSGKGSWRSDDPAYYDFNDEYDNDGKRLEAEGGDLGYGVRHLFGLLASQEATLVGMNDGDDKNNVRRHSFAEIADYIEKNL